MTVLTLHVTVAGVTEETPEIRSFDLVAPDGGMLPAFAAGAHVDVHLADGLLRQYSISSDPRDRTRYIIGVKREESGRGGSKRMHAVRTGDTLTISAPRNNFPLAEGATHHLLLSGGIGLTPILAMARTLAAQGAPFALCGFFRSAAHVPFRGALGSPAIAPHLRYHFDDPAAPEKLDIPALLADRAEGAHVYLCGPGGFMEAVRAAAQGWPEDAFHVEYFSAPDASAAPPHAPDGPFELYLKQSDLTFTVGKDQTIVQVLQAAGVDVLTSCEQGVCATCITPFLEGEPDHRDFCLSKVEQRTKMALCCSRAKTPRLVIDL